MNPLPKKTILKSARANAIYQSIKQQNQNDWNNGKKTVVLLRQMSHTIMAKAKPSTHIYEKIGNKRKHIAWIAKLRTGHCSLNQYLARFKITDDAKCPKCNEANKTVKHFLLVCPEYERKRDKLRRTVGIGGMRVDKMLGDVRRIEDTIQFIEPTKRFNF